MINKRILTLIAGALAVQTTFAAIPSTATAGWRIRPPKLPSISTPRFMRTPRVRRGTACCFCSAGQRRRALSRGSRVDKLGGGDAHLNSKAHRPPLIAASKQSSMTAKTDE